MKTTIFTVLVLSWFLISGTALAGVTQEISFGAGRMAGEIKDKMIAETYDTEGSEFDLLGYTLYFKDLEKAPKPETAVFNLHPSHISFEYGMSESSVDYPGSDFESDFAAYSLSGVGFLPFGLGFGAGLSRGERESGTISKVSRDYDEIFYGISYYIANKPHRISLMQVTGEYENYSEDKLNVLEWTSLFGDFFAFQVSFATGEREYASGSPESDLRNVGIGFGFVTGRVFSIYLDFVQKERERNLATSKVDEESFRVSVNPVFWFSRNVSLGFELATVTEDYKMVANTGTVLRDEDTDEVEFGFDMRFRF